MSKGLEALCYLDDIAHGRKMSLDPHELKLIIEKELKALEIIIKYVGASYISYLMRIGNADKKEIELVEEALK